MFLPVVLMHTVPIIRTVSIVLVGCSNSHDARAKFIHVTHNVYLKCLIIFPDSTLSSIQIGSGFGSIIRSWRSNGSTIFKHQHTCPTFFPILYIISNKMKLGHLCETLCRSKCRPECGPKCRSWIIANCCQYFFLVHGMYWCNTRGINPFINEFTIQYQHCHQYHQGYSNNHQKNILTRVSLLWHWI